MTKTKQAGLDGAAGELVGLVVRERAWRRSWEWQRLLGVPAFASWQDLPWVWVVWQMTAAFLGRSPPGWGQWWGTPAAAVFVVAAGSQRRRCRCIESLPAGLRCHNTVHPQKRRIGVAAGMTPPFLLVDENWNCASTLGSSAECDIGLAEAVAGAAAVAGKSYCLQRWGRKFDHPHTGQGARMFAE